MLICSPPDGTPGRSFPGLSHPLWRDTGVVGHLSEDPEKRRRGERNPGESQGCGVKGVGEPASGVWSRVSTSSRSRNGRLTRTRLCGSAIPAITPTSVGRPPPGSRPAPPPQCSAVGGPPPRAGPRRLSHPEGSVAPGCSSTRARLRRTAVHPALPSPPHPRLPPQPRRPAPPLASYPSRPWPVPARGGRPRAWPGWSTASRPALPERETTSARTEQKGTATERDRRQLRNPSRGRPGRRARAISASLLLLLLSRSGQ